MKAKFNSIRKPLSLVSPPDGPGSFDTVAIDTVERTTEISIAGAVSDGVSLPYIITIQPTLIIFEPVVPPKSQSPIKLDNLTIGQGTKFDPLRNARTVLSAFYPGSFPDPLRLSFGDEPVKTAPGPAPAAEPKPPGTLLSTEEAAAFLNISPESLRRLCRRKAVTFIQVMPREYRFHPDDLVEYVNSRRNRRKSIFKG